MTHLLITRNYFSLLFLSANISVLSKIPFKTIHNPSLPFEDSTRRCFLPGRKINIEIKDVEQADHSRLLNPNIYIVHIRHGPFFWTIKRRYKHFRHLHEQLMLLRAGAKLPIPTQKHRQRRKSFARKKQSLPKFPKRPDPLIRTEEMDRRKQELQDYLQNVLRHPQFRNHPETLKFLEVSHLSFVNGLGSKWREGIVKKRSGGRKIRLHLCGECCGGCHSTAHYQRRWLVLKDTFVAYVKPETGAVSDVLLMDREFEVKIGLMNTGIRHGMLISNYSRNLLVKCWTQHKSRQWEEQISKAAAQTGKDFTQPNRYESFAPVRSRAYCNWFVDAATYMSAVADGLESAKEEIFITDWWLSPELHLKRPVTEGDKWRLDYLLKRKACQGVKIFVLLFKEIEAALGINSYYSKQTLVGLHPTNIKVMRDPDGLNLWSHHEKCVVIDQRIAFLGGIDLCYGRWDTRLHRLTDLGSDEGIVETDVDSGQTQDEGDQGLVGEIKLWMGKDYVNFIFKDFVELDKPFTDMVDRSVTPRMPWHDIGAVCYGHPARDVARHFIQRWNFTKLHKQKMNIDYPMLLPKSYENFSVPSWVPQQAFTCNCQITRSSCEWSAGIKTIDCSIMNAYVDLIKNSKHYIYIENQFFISIEENPLIENAIGNALYERIMKAHRDKETFRVYVVLPLLPAFEGELGTSKGTCIQAIIHWNYASISRGGHSLLERLVQYGSPIVLLLVVAFNVVFASLSVNDPFEYISFYGLRTHEELIGNLTTELVYVHSKMMIVDDFSVIIGSANINDRSLLGKRDSELAIIVQDTHTVPSRMNGKDFQAGTYASSLRKSLFREHLGIGPTDTDIDVTDPVSTEFYKNVWLKQASINTTVYDKVFNCIPTEEVTSNHELREYQKKPVLAQTDPDKARKELKKVRGHLVLMPLQFLIQENLSPSPGTKEAFVPTIVWT
ncbi:hypothetical protein CAPTEDRAFT_168015 [Capitella teleta]|uniref:Phospholipase n=1 Tax=Capitella teleta TaxID=283909 RepID=R7ULW0_CAPTE|nr:hypothetical protein CAPTEDRAFT_168015 [Capitella teleta]|eukprot:ELU04927.1 hypothetical protein CAPTEDRAFT_168015 [Capitella teleta]